MPYINIKLAGTLNHNQKEEIAKEEINAELLEIEDFYKTHIELSQKLNLISKYLNEKDEQIIL